MKRKRLMEKSDTVPVVTPAADTDAANVLPSCSETAPTDHPPGDDGDTAGKCKQSTPIKVKLKRHVCQNIKNKTNPHSKDIKAECPKRKFQFPLSTEIKKKIRKQEFIDEIMKDDCKCFMYTGIPNVQLLIGIYEWLLPNAKNIKLWDGTGDISKGKPRSKLTLFEEMALTLVRIRPNNDTRHLAYLSGISQSLTSKIFLSWCKFLSVIFKPLLIWPSKDIVHQNLPDSFKNYRRTRVIIDATEFKIEKPFWPKAQKQTWSNYKHSNTFKLLVGIMPTGAITFLSKVYSRCISDVHITEKSGFLDKLSERDDVMADRGFNICHLLLPKKCTLNIPAFSHGKRLSKKAVKRSRRIAAVRIHVERAIRRMKTFRIISGLIPLRIRFCLDSILTIVAVLSNLQPRLAVWWGMWFSFMYILI